MANPDRPNGLSPVGTLSGASWQGLVRRVQMGDTSADTTGNHGDLYVGDPIVLSSGLAIPFDSNDANAVGVVVAIGYVADGVASNEAGPFNPAALEQRYAKLEDSDTETIWVYYAPAEDTIFEAQSDSDLDLLIGGTADLNIAAATAHGSRTTGRSNVEINASGDTDVTVVAIPEYPDNDSTLANTRYHVTFIDPLHR